MRCGIPVGKIARRLNVAPTLKTAKILNKRPNPPGVHGERRRGQKSIYSQQLIEKQRLRFQFMISEKTLRRMFHLARGMKGNTGENLLRILDERLDSTIFRSGVARSMLAARQLVTHGHVLVNGKRVDKPSYRLKEKDLVSFSDKAKATPVLMEGLKDGITVPYIELVRDQATIKRTSVAPRASIPVICNEQMIVEWYSR